MPHRSALRGGKALFEGRPGMHHKLKSFTLLELIIVVGIVAILALIAVPNFLAVQTRAKVSNAKSNIRVLIDATEVYRVDWNRYPPTSQQLPADPYGILSDVQLKVLTTPVQYIAYTSFRDPFGKIKSQALGSQVNAAPGDSDFPIPEAPNPKGSLLYYNYHYFSRQTHNPEIDACGIAFVSIGPDRKDSFGVFRPFSSDALPPLALQVGISSPLDTQYDPTNGTISSGDICGFAGEVAVPPCSGRLP